jgi:carboxypeptidase PM20D1
MPILVWMAIILPIASLAIATIRTILFKSRTTSIQPPLESEFTEIEQSAEHLSKAVSYPTISTGEASAFTSLHSFLADTYPGIHSHLEKIETGNERNLVFRWKGTDDSLQPALLMAHQDVVPADESDRWTYPPFSETIQEGFVWGRGSFDAKGQLIAIAEAVERLVSSGRTPRRTWYLAFGCDEETGGHQGAASIVEYCKRNGIRFAFVLDEGGVVAEGFVRGIGVPVAVVGIAEKGNVNIELNCTKAGGHSSSPANPTATGILGKAIWKIEKKKWPAHVGYPIRNLLWTLGTHAPFHLSLFLLNYWLFKPVILKIFKSNPTMNALVRTTMAVTMMEASHAPNIISNTATAVVNVRPLPEETTEEILQRLEKAISDERVEMTVLSDSTRSKVSSLEGEGFRLISAAIQQTFAATPTSYLMAGGTDALHYEAVCDHVYRFTPVVMDSGELSRMHNIDERLSLENLKRAVHFYMTLILLDSE